MDYKRIAWELIVQIRYLNDDMAMDIMVRALENAALMNHIKEKKDASKN